MVSGAGRGKARAYTTRWALSKRPGGQETSGWADGTISHDSIMKRGRKYAGKDQGPTMQFR